MDDEQRIPNVGLADFVAWTKAKFPKCGHPKFGSNLTWDNGLPRCRQCRMANMKRIRQKKYDSTARNRKPKRG